MKSWQGLLGQEMEKAYFVDLLAFIENRRNAGVNVFPGANEVFTAFTLTTPENLKVVVLGQDPYHGAGQANGLSFSVQQGVKIPPSLRNIYKALENDINEFQMPNHGDLSDWARQGVLLINTVLTVEEGKAHSHKGQGWEKFTDTVILRLSENLQDVIFLLWGNPAKQKLKLIDTRKHHVLTSVHPSPLSAHRGFLACQHFSQTNQILSRLGKPEINWQI